MKYRDFLAFLRRWISDIGLDSMLFASHSCRRGISSDWAKIRIPDKVRKYHGRWKSMKVADSYIDESVEVQLQVDAFKKANKMLR